MNRIGFSENQYEQEKIMSLPDSGETMAPSLVEVHFDCPGRTLSYFNNQFDLHEGDLVFVEGQMKDIPGRVKKVSHRFKICSEDYKKVVARADTDVRGELSVADRFLVCTEENTIPFEKVMSWYKAPEEREYCIGQEEKPEWFPVLLPGEKLPFDEAVRVRGENYYEERRVVYLEYRSGQVRAIVLGTKPYTVEFRYSQGKVSLQSCDCFYNGSCKHEYAAFVQFRELLDCFPGEGEEKPPEYFAAVDKAEFFETVIAGKGTGSVCVK